MIHNKNIVFAYIINSILFLNHILDIFKKCEYWYFLLKIIFHSTVQYFTVFIYYQFSLFISIKVPYHATIQINKIVTQLPCLYTATRSSFTRSKDAKSGKFHHWLGRRPITVYSFWISGHVPVAEKEKLNISTH